MTIDFLQYLSEIYENIKAIFNIYFINSMTQSSKDTIVLRTVIRTRDPFDTFKIFFARKEKVN